MSHVIGIDKGTSVVKTAVFDAEGREVGVAERRVEVLRPRAGWHEEDPERTWALCAETVREALTSAGVDGRDVAGIGVAGHMGGAWLLSGDGRPVRNAICWPDERAQSEQMELERAGVLDRVFVIGGNGLMPGITVMVLAWLARHEPGTRQRTRHVLCAKDYLRFRLTGEVATDPSDVTFMPSDVDRRAYSPEIFQLCGADKWLEALPPILPSDAVAGTVSTRAAAETGLRAGTPVICGLGDACANTVGVGRIAPGEALTVLGTSCLNSQVTAAPDREPPGLGFLFAMPLGRYLRILPNTSGTITMDWFLERFGGARTGTGQWDFAAIETEAARMPRGSGGVLLLPYVNGSGVLAPFFDTQGRGAFFGMGSHTSRDHLQRAVYESLCFATRDCFEAMERKPTSLLITGGGSRSPFWAQLFADVCGVPIETSAVTQSGALGVALLAGTAAGLWPDLPGAVAATARPGPRYKPDPDAAAEYNGWFSLYRDARDIYRRHFAPRARLAGRSTAA